MHTSGRICSVEVAGEGRGTGVGNGGEHFGSDMGRNDFSRNPIRGMNMQQQTAHLAGDERVKFFTGRLWGHLFGRTSGRRRPTAGHRAGRADGAPAEKRGGAVRGLAPLAGVCLFLMGMATMANGQYAVNFDGSSDFSTYSWDAATPLSLEFGL